METAGLDLSDIVRIEEHSTITRVYYCSPGEYSPNQSGMEHTNYRDALLEAIERVTDKIRQHRERFEERVRRIREGNARTDSEVEPEPTYEPIPETLWVDVRWIISYDARPLTDVLVSRTRYDHLDDAVAHLDRLSIPGEY